MFRKKRAQLRARQSLLELAKQGRVLPPALGTVPCEYISIPAGDIPNLASAYAQAMESQETLDWCRCEWIIHPDDLEVKSGCCRECGNKKDHFVHSDEAEDHPFRGRRMRMGDSTANDCPIHTKEGMIIYFFEWVFTRGKN